MLVTTSTIPYARASLTPASLAALAVAAALVTAAAGVELGGDRSPAPAAARTASATEKLASQAYGRLPLRFEANRGQTDPRVKFIARGAGYTLFLTPQESVLSLREPSPRTQGSKAAPDLRGARSAYTSASSAAVRMRLAGANPHPQLTGLSPLPGQANYLIGRDPRAWHTGVPGYASVLSRAEYPGVDLLYHGRQGQLEYDFRVAPGADLNRIALAFSGARRLSLDRAGNLVLDTAAGVLRQHRPVVYQPLRGHRQPVSGRFVLQPGNRVGFRLGAYDHSRPVVIDPILLYSTYLGGSTGGTYANAVTTDSSGAAYIAGQTGAIDFPVSSGAFQKTRGGNPANGYSSNAFVTKFDPAGDAVVYSTFLGGSSGDAASAIAVDSSGRAYLTGDTNSADFPTTPNGFDATQPASGPEAFVSVLSASGAALVYSTYLGGTPDGNTGVGTASAGVAVDSSGEAYVTGYTAASDFPTKAPAPATPLQSSLNNTSGIGDAFVAKLDPAATGASSLVYSTYLGGQGHSGGGGIAIDAAGNAYVGGDTTSTAFPVDNAFEGPTGGIAAGNHAGFVAELNSTGSGLLYSTYLGGSANDPWTNDSVTAIALDSTDHVYVTGYTSSTSFPTTPDAFQLRNAGNPPVDGASDAFVTKLDPTASGESQLVYSSYLGGANEDFGAAIAVTPAGTAYVAGTADSGLQGILPLGTFPSVDPVAASAAGGDAFVAEVKPDGSGLPFSTYLGGGGGETGAGVAVDPSGDVYVTGHTASTDFPTRNAYQPQNLALGIGDRPEGFVAKLARVDPAAPLVSGLGRRSGPAGTSLVLTGHGFTGASSVDFGSVAASTFTVDSDRQITVIAPPGASGPVPVTVTTSQGTSPPNPIATFTYAQGIWDLTGSLRVARQYGQTATLLGDGRVLVAGGFDRTSTASAELYDPASGTWTTTASMGTARQLFTATLLSNGKVLVAGGLDQNYNTLASAELYDPASGTWSATGSLVTARSGQTATLLSNGEVLVAGGIGSQGNRLASAELYDPASGNWSPAGSLADARSEDTATLLPDGKVLVAGGIGSNYQPISTAELYDPATNSWATTSPLSAARADQTATLLSDGRVLIAGGDQSITQSLSSAEVYDPSSGTFSATAAMAVARTAPAAALLSDGRVLVAGGIEGNASMHDTAELYDPTTNQWSSAGLMNRYRGYGFQGPEVFALPLATGNVLVGGDSADAGATTELYNPAPPVSPTPGPGPGAGAGAGTGPGPGPGAVTTVTTEPASNVTVTTAVLHGVIGTGGIATSWQFQYGRTTRYGSGTPVETIPAGKGVVSVSLTVRRLSPLARYHFRLVGLTGSGAGLKSTYGRDLSFTTRATGRLLLDRARLVVRHGVVSALFTCSSSVLCASKLSITTRARLGKSHKLATVLCATTRRFFKIGAHRRLTVRVSVRSACLALLRRVRHHRIGAKLTANPHTGQHAVIRKVILFRE